MPSSAKVVKLPSLHSRRLPLASGQWQRDRLQRLPLEEDFHEALQRHDQWPMRASGIGVMQLNLGKQCNQTCRHCHVDAGPDRTEVMSRQTMEACLRALEASDIPVVDITGGAPEMNPNFRWLVERCKDLGRHVMDRCNLTILETGPHRELPEFFAEHGVEVVCSLPHYRSLATDTQRGDGVFERSIRALKRLNEVGYGDPSTGLRLVLVTNPVGAFLPASQASLEREWQLEMARRYDVRFDALYCITNMPISRYLEWLEESGNLEAYMARLVSSFNATAARGVMCRSTLSVGWDGGLYDCDFNQMLDLQVDADAPQHIDDFDVAALKERRIQVDRHCFGCTAGAGSSCGGEVA